MNRKDRTNCTRNQNQVPLILVAISSMLTIFCLQETAAQVWDEMVTIPDTFIRTTDAETEIPVGIFVSSYMIGKTEVTQNQFVKVMGFNPSFYKGGNRPVEGVSWWVAIGYCNKRSLQEGLEPCYDLVTGNCDFTKNGYRLPTGTEWDIAGGCTGWDPDEIETEKQGNIGSSNVTDIQILADQLKSGTSPVARYEANCFGLYDMSGNVWEWCYDYYDAVYASTPACLINPSGNSWGIERIIRGGSFASKPSKRGMQRSSLKPDDLSRFTGFRVARSSGKRNVRSYEAAGPGWFDVFDQAPEGFRDNLGPVRSLLRKESGGSIESLTGWEDKKKEIQKEWEDLLGKLSIDTPPEVNVKVIETFDEDIYQGKLMYLQVEPGFWEKIYLMIPDQPVRTPTPVVITPYYDVDAPAGRNMGGYYRPKSVRHFSYVAVQHGYIALAVKWFAGSYGESYPEAVANLHLRHPGCTGFGKWVWDSKRVLDYLYSLPYVDKNNIGIIGHSLGSKLSLYAAAMDERISAAVISEGGISFRFSNYDAYWYFGKYIRDVQNHTDQHELLGLMAPRPLLLIGGGASDGDRSWYYINAGREVYNLYGKKENIGYFNHGTGHAPSPEAVNLAFEWLGHFLYPDEPTGR
jgi:formylglycine-generating enzyme required for sulfatase activity